MNWKAKWIWSGGEASPRNCYWCARKEFDLAQAPREGRIAVTADSRYVLWVNGQYVGHGPVRAFAHRWRYDDYDITPQLRPGKNAVAVLVLHPGHSNFQYLEARGGLLAQVECDGQVVAATDASWRGAEHPSYSRRSPRISCQQAWAERCDARLEPQGWNAAGFDDSPWKPAEVVGEVGCAPWSELLPRDIPFLVEEPVYPARIMRTQVVRPPKQVWSMDLKPNLAPGNLTANRTQLYGLAAAVLECSEPMRLAISTVHNGFRFLAIDGTPVSWEDARNGIDLAAGEHLFVVDVTGNYHQWFAEFVFDYEKGSLSLKSLLGEAGYPFITIGPFAPEETAEIERLRTAGGDEIARHPKARPIQRAHTADVSVFALTTCAQALPETPRIEQPEAMLSASQGIATIHPVPDGDTEILIDFGKELVGFVEMELSAPAGAMIDLEGFENIQNGNIQWTDRLNDDFRYIARQGWQRWRSVVRRGFRYAALVVRFPEGRTEPVRIKTLRCDLSAYPYVERGQFESSDALLKRIWDISRWTVTLCSEDTFVDCPAYEQTFWVGDARNESLFSYTAYGDPRLARRCLLLAGESLWRSPLVESQVPSGWENILPAWSLMWAVACEEHYLYTGDLEFLREVYPAIKKQNENIQSKFLNADGLFEITAWNMLDWAPMDTPGAGVVTHQNMWQVQALRASARMARILGKEEDARAFARFAEALKEAINKHLWDEEKQGYIDSIHADGVRSSVFSQQTQTIAYLCDIIPESKRTLFERYLTEVPEGWVRVGSPFMMAFTIEALEKAGDRGRILELIRKWWGMMVENDATTCWETFPEALHKTWNTRSYCHAWSAAPAYALPTYILGVKPLAPGFERFEIRPYLADLRFARGTVPTPKGDVDVSLRRDGNTTHLTFTVPTGTKAVVKGEEYGEGRYEVEL